MLEKTAFRKRELSGFEKKKARPDHGAVV